MIEIHDQGSPHGTKDSRRKTLLVARESSVGEAAKVLLSLLFQRIVSQLDGTDVDLPDFDDVIDVYERPAGENVRVFNYPKLDTRVVLIVGERTDVLLSLGSARKTDADGDNAFVNVLIEVLHGEWYDKVVTTSIERLCRNEEVAGSLLHVLRRKGTEVWLGRDWKLDLNKATDAFVWQFLVFFASQEAIAIQARTLAGKAARAAAGEWPFGYAPPPGWQKTEDGRLEVDTYTAAAVRWYIARVIEGETNWAQLARETLRRWPNLQLRRGEGGVATAGNPAQVLRTTFLNPAWREAFVDCRYEVTFVPHDLKIALESPDVRFRERAEKELEQTPVISVQLPPLDEPILARGDIPRLEKQLEVLQANTTPPRQKGSAIGAGAIVDASMVEDRRADNPEKDA